MTVSYLIKKFCSGKNPLLERGGRGSYLNIFFQIFLLLNFSSKAFAEPLSLFDHKTQLENQITKKIATDLSAFLEAKFYQVSVNAKVSTGKVLSQELVQETDSPKKALQPVLPGFQDFSVASESNQKNTTHTFLYSEDLKFLNITLFIDQSLPEEKLKLVQDYFQENWISLNLSLVHMQTKRVNIPQEPFDFSKILLGGSAALVLIIVLLILQRRNNQASSQSLLESGSSASAKETGDDSDFKLRKRFLSQIFEQQNFSRAFLVALDGSAKVKILAFFHHSKIKELLCHWMELPPNTINTHAEIDLDFLKVIFDELCAFQKWQEQKTQCPFGYLSVLALDESRSLLQDESLETLSVALSHLPQIIAGQIVKELSLERQSALIETFLSLSKISNASLIAIDKKLRQKYESLQTTETQESLSMESMTELILENSSHVTTLAGRLVSRNQNYQKYLMSFTDLFKQETTSLKNILSDLDNETLILACLKNEAEWQKVESVLSVERRKVLASLKKSLGQNLSTVQVEQAQDVVVRKMRQMIYPA